MVQYCYLDVSLAEGKRRDVLEQLGRGEASIIELADKFRMTLAGMKKHVSVREQAGLVITRRSGVRGPAGSASCGWRRQNDG